MTSGDFRDLGPPPALLHRYRPANEVDKGYLEELVVKHRVWATSPKRFNDPSDFRIRIDYSGTDEEWRTHLGEQFARNRARFPQDAAQPAPSLDPPFWRETAFQSSISDDLQSNLDSSGVICLCQSPTIPLMWAHYASGHAGICLQFETSAAPFSECLRVKYQNEVPVTRVNAGAEALVRASLLTKAKWWQYEAEWRFISYKRGEGYRKVAPSALRAVIVGAKADKTLIEQVQSICKGRNPAVQVLQAAVRSDSYELRISALP